MFPMKLFNAVMVPVASWEAQVEGLRHLVYSQGKPRLLSNRSIACLLVSPFELVARKRRQLSGWDSYSLAPICEFWR